MYPRFTHLCILTFLLCTPSYSQVTQPTQGKDAPAAEQSSLQGVTEAVLVNGQPALRILTPKSGTTEILYQKRDNEDALVFPIVRFKKLFGSVVPGDTGKFYVTRTRLIYDPDGSKENFFNFARAEIKEATREHHGRGNAAFNDALIKTEKDTRHLVPRFTVDYAWLNKSDLLPALDFFLRALNNFDSALAEFQQLTASVRPEAEDGDEEEEEETTAEITDKYDRFKDVTVVRTSRMMLRGGRRSIRTFAEYSFAGKNPTKPEKVSLYFYASAARPVFREDELELNFLVDDERVAVGSMRLSDEEKTKSSVRQTVVISLPYETFARIANGSKVELQIGTLEYKMTDTHLDAFRRLLARSDQK